ncbi:MAG: SseB family protein [Planktomarina sp.]|nr:SseB family protein [Planktomarina sp.]
MTPLERSIIMLEAAPDDTTRFSAVIERLVDAEVFLALEATTSDVEVKPRTVLLNAQEYIAIYDTELRLAEAIGGEAEYLTVSGRALVQMLESQNVGIALNPGTTAIGYIFELETLRWLALSLDERPNEMSEQITQVSPPPVLSPKALDALSIKLTAAQGLAEYAVLVEATGLNGAKNPTLFFVGLVPDAQADLAKLIQEYLQFSEQGSLAWDISYLAPTHSIVDKLLHVGLRFDLPAAEVAVDRPAPGSVPGQPPILR